MTQAAGTCATKRSLEESVEQVRREAKARSRRSSSSTTCSAYAYDAEKECAACTRIVERVPGHGPRDADPGGLPLAILRRRKRGTWAAAGDERRRGLGSRQGARHEPGLLHRRWESRYEDDHFRTNDKGVGRGRPGSTATSSSPSARTARRGSPSARSTTAPHALDEGCETADSREAARHGRAIGSAW